MADSHLCGAASSGTGGRVFADLGGGAGYAAVAANFLALGTSHWHSACRAAVAGWAGLTGRGAGKGVGARATSAFGAAGTLAAYREERKGVRRTGVARRVTGEKHEDLVIETYRLRKLSMHRLTNSSLRRRR